MEFRRIKQDECQILFINEISREVKLVKGKAKEGQILYKDRAWLVQTDPLFYNNSALYIVSDKQIPTFEIDINSVNGESEGEQREDQNSLSSNSLSPTALKTAVTTSFFKALMSPVHWDRGDWIKALGVGFSFYILMRWIFLSVFKVPLP